MRELFVLKNNDTVLVREATVQDAFELTGLVRAIYGTADTVLTSLEEFDQLDSLNGQLLRIQHYQRAPGYLLLVAEMDGRLVGTLDFANGHRQRIAHTGEFNMGVAPSYQNRGIGRRMIQVMLHWATAHPLLEKIKLTAFATNHNGLHLYKSLGFVEEGRGVREIKLTNDQYVDVINLYKNVKS
jgi:RimJ/RimL family protein N-acetyltransferase